MSKRKVLITGGTGYVAGRMLPVLRERYDLTILDVKTTNREGEEVSDVVIADLTNRDRDAYRANISGGRMRSSTADLCGQKTRRIAFGQR